jgi:hypothetical protein
MSTNIDELHCYSNLRYSHLSYDGLCLMVEFDGPRGTHVLSLSRLRDMQRCLLEKQMRA